MESQRPNRIRAAHLLLWMLGIAALLAWLRSELAEFIRAEPVLLRVFYVTQASTIILARGAALAGLIIAGFRTVRRTGGFPVQPGHWLLVAIGLELLMSMGITGVIALLKENDDSGNLVWMHAAEFSLPAIAFVVVVARALWNSVSWTGFWRIAIGGVMFSHGSGVLVALALLTIYRFDGHVPFNGWDVFSVYSQWLALATAVIVSTVAISDGLRAKRDAFHWIGVISYVVPIYFQFVYGLIVIHYLRAD
jgi:hypothetical protein